MWEYPHPRLSNNFSDLADQVAWPFHCATFSNSPSPCPSSEKTLIFRKFTSKLITLLNYLHTFFYSLFRNSMAWFQKKIWFRYLSSEIGTNVLVQLQNNFIDLYYLKIWAQNFRQNLKKGHNLLWNTLWMGN